jgi:hypothetical protein
MNRTPGKLENGFKGNIGSLLMWETQTRVLFLSKRGAAAACLSFWRDSQMPGTNRVLLYHMIR